MIFIILYVYKPHNWPINLIVPPPKLCPLEEKTTTIEKVLDYLVLCKAEHDINLI